MRVKPNPCEFCPYRRDTPSGVWGAHEYEKLAQYDASEMLEQPAAAFHCHATPQDICNGWAIVHGPETLAFRLAESMAEQMIDIPPATVELYGSGVEACEAGLRDIEAPSVEARAAMVKLGKYRRIASENPWLVEDDDDDEWEIEDE